MAQATMAPSGRNSTKQRHDDTGVRDSPAYQLWLGHHGCKDRALCKLVAAAVVVQVTAVGGTVNGHLQIEVSTGGAEVERGTAHLVTSCGDVFLVETLSAQSTFARGKPSQGFW
jgi:hypothetical protein